MLSEVFQSSQKFPLFIEMYSERLLTVNVVNISESTSEDTQQI